MIDTIAIVSPPLAPSLREHITHGLGSLRRTEPGGVLNFELFTGDIEGSYDHRTSVRLTHDGRLRVEGSLHKSIDGTNFANGPTQLLPAARLYVSLVEITLSAQLPIADAWKPHRVDLARTWELKSLAAVQAVIEALGIVRVQNRPPRSYESNGLRWGGAHGALKVYAKGPEFRANDRKRYREALKRSLATKQTLNRYASVEQFTDQEKREVESMLAYYSSDPVEAAVLFMQEEANRLLRVETEMKRKAIEYRIGPNGTVVELTDEMLRDYFWKHAEPLTLSSPERERVNTHEAVRSTLFEAYGSRQGMSLYATWIDLCRDPDSARRSRTPRTFYDHKRKLKAAGCSWIGSDIAKCSPLVPADLDFREGSPYLVPDEENATVSAALAPYRLAA